MDPVLVSFSSLLISLALGIIKAIEYYRERKIYAEMYEELDFDDWGTYFQKPVIVLSTKGTSPIYYTDYRIFQINGDERDVVLVDPDFPTDVLPGVITNSQPKLIKDYQRGTLPFKTMEGKEFKYEIELMITGVKKRKLIKIFKREWTSDF